LVPATWQLIQRSAGGTEQVVAKHVLSYDLCADGAIVYTDGVKVQHLRDGDAEPTTIAEGKLIERVAVIAASA
jgi:hypothetical protein